MSYIPEGVMTFILITSLMLILLVDQRINCYIQYNYEDSKVTDYLDTTKRVCRSTHINEYT